MSGIMLFLSVLLATLFLFSPFFVYFWDKIFGVSDLADQLFYARTDDGWKIAMHYHEPENPLPGAFPIVLSHGILVNKFCLDMDHRHSLAHFLKKNGYPVFVVSLRGTGESYHISRSGYRDFSFDDIIENDIPAVIRTVKELTGAPGVNWVGHSMGAMIACGFLGRKLPGHEDINSLISIAGPGKVDHVRNTAWGPLTRYPGFNRALNIRFSTQAIVPITGLLLTPVENVVYSKENLTSKTIRRLMKNGIENIAPGLFKQFSSWVQTGDETTVDGTFNYRDGQKNITAPSLFIAAPLDKIAPPDSVKYTYEVVSSKEKSYLLMDRRNGCSADYCHVGLVLGERSEQDVFPWILDWLNLHGSLKRPRKMRARLRKKFKQ